MFSFIFMIMILGLIFKGSFFILGLFGRLIGGMLGLIGYFILGMIMISVFGIGIFVIPIILIVAAVNLVGLFVKAV